jgi:hypothetical protein
MRMRVARTHHRAAILEHLHIVDIVSLAEFDILLRPRITTARISFTAILAGVRSCRREKQTTRQTPFSPSATNNRFPSLIA